VTDPSTSPPRVATRVAQALVLILVASASGFAAYRIANTHKSTLTPMAAPATGPAPIAAPAAAHEVPETVPDIALTDREGAKRGLSSWKGHPLIINFWATWCEPCRREIPLLKTLRADHAKDGLEVIGIAVDFRDAVVKYAQQMGIDYPVLIGEQDALQAVSAFGMETVFPFTVFADRQGRIVTLKVGELHQDEAAFILQRLHDVDAGSLALPAARQQISAGIRDLAVARARSAESAASGK
jgi:thiol-disulfide isomerase/thioredoxin